MRKKKYCSAIREKKPAICDSPEAIQKKIEQNIMLAGSPQLVWHKTWNSEVVYERINANASRQMQIQITNNTLCTTNKSKTTGSAALECTPHQPNITVVP